ncbi:1453_t:CDS:2, partial [Gigaspora margarita]
VDNDNESIESMDVSSTVDNNYSKFDGVNNSHEVAQVDEIESNLKRKFVKIMLCMDVLNCAKPGYLARSCTGQESRISNGCADVRWINDVEINGEHMKNRKNPKWNEGKFEKSNGLILKHINKETNGHTSNELVGYILGVEVNVDGVIVGQEFYIKQRPALMPVLKCFGSKKPTIDECVVNKGYMVKKKQELRDIDENGSNKKKWIRQ